MYRRSDDKFFARVNNSNSAIQWLDNFHNRFVGTGSLFDGLAAVGAGGAAVAGAAAVEGAGMAAGAAAAAALPIVIGGLAGLAIGGGEYLYVFFFR